jgi:hypothetical protein
MKRLMIQNFKVGLFFFAIQLFVGLIFLYKSFNQATVIGTALISCVTTLVFLFVIAVIQVIYMKNNEISLNDFDIKPTQKTIFSVDKTYEETLAIIQNTIPEKIKSYQFKYDTEQDVYKARTGASILSWGEEIIIKITKLDNFKIQLSVLSKSLLKTTLTDYGKSSTNIKKIKLAFE